MNVSVCGSAELCTKWSFLPPLLLLTLQVPPPKYYYFVMKFSRTSNMETLAEMLIKSRMYRLSFSVIILYACLFLSTFRGVFVTLHESKSNYYSRKKNVYLML